MRCGFDKDNRPSAEKNTSGVITKHAVQYGALADNRYIDYTYDTVGRVSERKQRNGTGAEQLTSYTFAAGPSDDANSATPLVTGITQPGLTLAYTYDDTGNILTEVKDGHATSYVYDKLGQLTRVNDPHESATWEYKYDSGGNIEEKRKYAHTTGALGGAYTPTAYAYDSVWKDKLTGYGEKEIAYDAIGNPLSYDGWTYSWVAGRKLARMSKGAGGMAPQDVYGSITSDPSDMSVSHTPGSAGPMFTLAEGELSAEAEGYSLENGDLSVAIPQDMSGMSIEYSYDAAGLRTQKKVIENGEISITDYTLHRKLIMELRKGNDTLHFFYDAQSRPAMVEWNGVWYSYLHNLQGDIIAIVDVTGGKVVEYTYNAWGRVLATSGIMANTLGRLNPFRYRGYLYDEETGLYYLRTRYYNPEWGRFINEDSLIGKTGKLLSHNMFAYCKNNPVLFMDSDGRILELAIDTTAENKEYYEIAVEYLHNSEIAISYMARLKAEDSVITIILNNTCTTAYDPDTKTIYWDPTCGMLLDDMKSIQSPAVGLIHEMGHASQDIDGQLTGRAEAELEAENLQNCETPHRNTTR